MAKRNRSTLKNYFRKGKLPSEDHFGDLIDSTLNTVDEGFDKSREHGFEISSLGDYDSLISFFRSSDPKDPRWTISYDGRQDDTLLFKKHGEHGEQYPVLSLAMEMRTGTDAAEMPAARVGINTKDPQYTLDVGGVIRAEGRIGNWTKQNVVPADGRWHKITEALDGCHAFEVVAGAGRKATGKYALMHAVVLNAYNPKGLLTRFLKKRIRYSHAYYQSRGNKLKLRWVGSNRGYFLELRSNCDYGDAIQIQYHVTQLWFDNRMLGSQPGLNVTQETPDSAEEQ